MIGVDIDKSGVYSCSKLTTKEGNMKNTIKSFQDKMRKEGRSFKWFHKTYLKNISYVYFMIQLHDQDRLHDSVRTAIEKYLKENNK